MPDVAEANISRRVANLTNTIRTLIAAVRVQESRVDAAQSKFGAEIAAGLKPAMEDVVRRIAAGMETARSAVLENRLILTAVAVATGGHNESCPCFTFGGVSVPTGSPDAFTHWLDTMRRQGFAV
jgi:hypothetical protein